MPSWGFKALFCAMALLSISDQADAAQIQSEPLNGYSKRVFISITGNIAKGDVEKFRRVAIANDDAVVWLASLGGSTIEAIEIGKIIRIKGYDTFVHGDAPCVSACALIWLAGSTVFI